MSSAPRRCLGDVGDVDGFTHGRLRIQAKCSSSASSLARLGRASFTSSSRRSSRPYALSARLRRCEPPPSRTYSQGHCALDVGSNCPPGSRSLAASQSFQATVPPSAQSPTFNVESRLSEGGGWARSFNVESQGPALRCLGASRAEECYPCLAALGRRRFAPPRRARSRACASSLPHQRGVA